MRRLMFSFKKPNGYYKFLEVFPRLVAMRVITQIICIWNFEVATQHYDLVTSPARGQSTCGPDNALTLSVITLLKRTTLSETDTNR